MGMLIRCRLCDENKSPREFYENRLVCKECVKAGVRKRARRESEVQDYDRERAKTPERRAKARALVVKCRKENPQGYKAQTAVGNALRDGKLFKASCEICGRADVHAHHQDYAKPLEVRWLCPLHHHRLHADDPTAEGANKTMHPA